MEVVNTTSTVDPVNMYNYVNGFVKSNCFYHCIINYRCLFCICVFFNQLGEYRWVRR